jgi:hypothetical protein
MPITPKGIRWGKQEKSAEIELEKGRSDSKI